MKTLARYVCEVCTSEYETEAEARECEALGFKPTFAVGDIVVGDPGHCWYDGDKRWIKNPDVHLKTRGGVCPDGDRNCFGECCTYVFYWVVTKVDQDPWNWSVERFGQHRRRHRPRYHVMTLAIGDRANPRQGWTFDQGHKTMRKVDRPPKYVVRTSLELLGREAGWLL